MTEVEDERYPRVSEPGLEVEFFAEAEDGGLAENSLVVILKGICQAKLSHRSTVSVSFFMQRVAHARALTTGISFQSIFLRRRRFVCSSISATAGSSLPGSSRFTAMGLSSAAGFIVVRKASNSY